MRTYSLLSALLRFGVCLLLIIIGFFGNLTIEDFAAHRPKTPEAASIVPSISMSLIRNVEEATFCFRQVETQQLPSCTRCFKTDSQLKEPYEAAVGAISMLPEDVQCDVQLKMSSGISGGLQTTLVELVTHENSLKSVTQSQTLCDIAETCNDSSEMPFLLQMHCQAFLDCVALQLGHLSPYNQPAGAARALLALQVCKNGNLPCPSSSSSAHHLMGLESMLPDPSVMSCW
jgi:hypothetical protein